ncbi:MAG TPA: glycosyltransferase [Patescibacteria group bacterium]|nr:glycosyltransferase [Patescibacteria group bacterium]
MKNNTKVVMILAEPCHNDSRVMRQARTLSETGYGVTILALYGKGLNRIEEHDGYRIIRLCCWLPGSGIVAMVAREFFFYITSFLFILWSRPLVCHIHNPRALMPGVLAAKLVGAKIIYDSHELWGEAVHRTDFPQWIFRVVVGLEKFLAHRADVVLAVSGYIVRVLRKRFRKPVFLIRNVSDGPQITLKGDLLRKSLGLSGDPRKIVLYQGLFSPGRGLFEIIEAMQWATGAVLIFLGYEGTHGIRVPDMKAKIDGLGLSQKVFIYGPVPADMILQYTASADIGVCSIQAVNKNHVFCLPNKFFSYVMAGLSVAVSNLPEMGRLVNKYSVGVTFDPTDPRDIAEKLNTLLGSNGVYQKNIARFNRVFNWEREGRRMLNIYKKLLSI